MADTSPMDAGASIVPEFPVKQEAHLEDIPDDFFESFDSKSPKASIMDMDPPQIKEEEEGNETVLINAAVEEDKQTDQPNEEMLESEITLEDEIKAESDEVPQSNDQVSQQEEPAASKDLDSTETPANEEDIANVLDSLASKASPIPIRVKQEKELAAENPKSSASNLPPRFGIHLKKPSDLFESNALRKIKTEQDKEDKEDGEDSSDSSEDLPEDFFDAVLEDNVQKGIEANECLEIETKYSERLKILKNLEKLEKEKKRKREEKQKEKEKERKPKKNKKKHKHSDRSDHSESPRKRRRSRSNSMSSDSDQPSSSKKTKAPNPLRIRSDLTTKVPKSLTETIRMPSLVNPFSQSSKSASSQAYEHPLLKTYQPKVEKGIEENEEKLTHEEKIIKALSLTSLLRKQLKSNRMKCLPLFQFTNTIRKLPSSSSMFCRQGFEDRSPLNAINNVEYSFNAKTTKINLMDYGLEQMPKALTHPARMMGLDWVSLHHLATSIKIPPTVQLKHRRPLSSSSLESKGNEASGSIMFRHVAIQTQVSMFQDNGSSREVEIQTEESGPSLIEVQFPLIKTMKNMTENQLYALHNFADLVMAEMPSQPSELLRIRDYLMDIYKMSARPSNNNFSGLARPQEEHHSSRSMDFRFENVRSLNQGRPDPRQLNANGRTMAESHRGNFHDPRRQSYAHRYFENINDVQAPEPPRIGPITTSYSKKNYGRGSSRRR